MFSWYDFQVLHAVTSCSAIVIPSVVVTAGYEAVPSMLMSPGGPCVSLDMSMAGVAASVPLPVIGQTAPDGGLSVSGTPVARFVMQFALCQSGALSLSTPKLEPPTTSR